LSICLTILFPSVPLGILAVFSGLAISASPVIAANYGGFGSTYAEVINPKDAVLNDELAKTEDVKSGLASLEGFKTTINTIRADLVSEIYYLCTFYLHFEEMTF
jgi:hypothetical protein